MHCRVLSNIVASTTHCSNYQHFNPRLAFPHSLQASAAWPPYSIGDPAFLAMYNEMQEEPGASSLELSTHAYGYPPGVTAVARQAHAVPPAGAAAMYGHAAGRPDAYHGAHGGAMDGLAASMMGSGMAAMGNPGGEAPFMGPPDAAAHPFMSQDLAAFSQVGGCGLLALVATGEITAVRSCCE